MAVCKFQNSVVIGDYKSPYIVAEVNSSHGGDIEIAKEMVREAKEIGCDCVKFQSWSATTLYSKSYYNENRMAKRLVEKFSFSEKQLLEVAKYCLEIGISFSSTPYSEEEARFLVEECNVPYIKIASMELNNHNFLRYIAKLGCPIVLSTGMGDMEEIKAAVRAIEETGNRSLCILHCVANYPAEAATINLNNIIELREVFPEYPIGYSDHTIGTEVAAAAVALGAALIEKHFSLDRKRVGMDNQMATESEDMRKLVLGCHNVYNAMGIRERIVSETELEQRKKMRRSIVAKRAIKAGEILSKDDLGAKRPGTGVPVDKIEWLLGKTIIRDVAEDELIQMEDLL